MTTPDKTAREAIEDIFKNRAFAECTDVEKVEAYLDARDLEVAILKAEVARLRDDIAWHSAQVSRVEDLNARLRSALEKIVLTFHEGEAWPGDAHIEALNIARAALDDKPKAAP